MPSFWFGPLFKFELMRLARRGLHNRLRCGMGILLLAALFIHYASWFPQFDNEALLFAFDASLPIDQNARFCESFVVTLLLIQLGAAVILTPFLAVKSITEEFQKRTITFLLVSPMSEREIIMGKVVARIAYVLAILLTALPVVALMQVRGGVSMLVLLVGYLVIFCIMLGLGAMSAYIAADSMFAAENSFQRPVPHDRRVGVPPRPVATSPNTRADEPVEEALRDKPPPRRAPSMMASRPLQHRIPRPPVDERDPLLWKELNFPKLDATLDTDESPAPGNVLLVTVGVFLVLLAFGQSIGGGESFRSMIGGMVHWLGMIALCGWVGWPALRAAACVAREREQETLETLFTLPASRREILWAKWRSCWYCGRIFGVGLALLALVGLVSIGFGMASPWYILLTVPLAAIFIVVVRVFAVSLGLWLSTFCRTTFQATLALVASLAIAISLSSAITELAGALLRDQLSPVTAEKLEDFISQLNPASCWRTVTFAAETMEPDQTKPPPVNADQSKLPRRLLPASLVIVTMIVLSLLFCLDANRRFEREGRN